MGGLWGSGLWGIGLWGIGLWGCGGLWGVLVGVNDGIEGELGRNYRNVIYLYIVLFLCIKLYIIECRVYLMKLIIILYNDTMYYLLT